MSKKCLICNLGISNEDAHNLTPEESCFMLNSVLSLSGWDDGNDFKKLMFQSVCYCPVCWKQILEIRIKSEDLYSSEAALETLAKTFQIVTQLVETGQRLEQTTQSHSGNGTGKPAVGMLQQLRLEISKEILSRRILENLESQLAEAMSNAAANMEFSEVTITASISPSNLEQTGNSGKKGLSGVSSRKTRRTGTVNKKIMPSHPSTSKKKTNRKKNLGQSVQSIPANPIPVSKETSSKNPLEIPETLVKDEEDEVEESSDQPSKSKRTYKMRRKPARKKSSYDHSKKPSRQPVACEVCGKVLTRYSFWENHMKLFHWNGENRKYKCPITSCTFNGSSKLTLRVHLKTNHSDDKVPVCTECFKIFKTEIHLHTHTCLQGNVKRTYQFGPKSQPKQCEVCGLILSRYASWKYHMTLKHGDRGSQKCTLCDFKTVHANDLRKHIATHSEKRDFQCDLCSLSFKWKHNLTGHKRSHTNDSTFQCHICQGKFLGQTSLSKHLTACLEVKSAKEK